MGASSAHQKVVGSIPSQGAYGRQPIDISLYPLPLPLSLKSINIFENIIQTLKKEIKFWKDFTFKIIILKEEKRRLPAKMEA